MSFHRVKKSGLVWKCAKCGKWHSSRVSHDEGKVYASTDVGVVK